MEPQIVYQVPGRNPTPHTDGGSDAAPDPQMSKKHLQRYVNEFAYRANTRGLEVHDVFGSMVAGVINNSTLPYKQLTGAA